METADEPTNNDSSQSGKSTVGQSESMETDQSEVESGMREAEGRLKAYGELKLLNVDELLYVPVTQEPAPMTEDMLEEHAEVLAK
jgi:Rab3 GTPase-activating protein catalytic subunit